MIFLLLLALCGSDSYAVRSRATDALSVWCALFDYDAALARAERSHPDPEVRLRARLASEALPVPSTDYGMWFGLPDARGCRNWARACFWNWSVLTRPVRWSRAWLLAELRGY